MNTSAGTSKQLLNDAASRLREAGVDTPVLDAVVLLSSATGLTRTQLMTHPEFVPTSEQTDKFLRWVDRRADREPLPYITGEREFYGLTFEVTPDVLIPRPETEILVETAVTALSGIESPLVADIGVGSGAIAITIAHCVPHATVYGTDSSAAALDTARRNADCIGVAERLTLLQGDLLKPLSGKLFDLIVSNPPYIPSADIAALEPEVARFEPRQALDGGPDGLDCYHRLAADSPSYLKPGGLLMVEIGAGEATAVRKIFEENGFKKVRTVPDYADILRIVTAVWT